MTSDGEAVLGGERVRAELVAFVRALRDAGASVPENAAFPAVAALLEVGLADREAVQVALRASLLTAHEDERVFDRLFPEFWRRFTEAVDAASDTDAGEDADEPSPTLEPMQVERGDEDDAREREDGDPPDPERGTASVARTDSDGEHEPGRSTVGDYSRVGRSERVEDAAVYGADTEAVRGPIRRLRRALGTQVGRRWRSASAGEQADARRALRRSHATGGAVLPLPERERVETDVRGVVLVDVSQSILDTLDPDLLLCVLRVLHEEWRRLRVFFFDTDVQEVTDAVGAADGDVYRALERAQAEWGGGTRIGETLSTLREEHPYLVDRDTVLLVVSDALERGNVDELAEGMAWAARRSSGVFWLNPLAASPSYEPTARGMAAALPYVDGLFAFTEASDLAEMARQLERRGVREVGYEYDSRSR